MPAMRFPITTLSLAAFAVALVASFAYGDSTRLVLGPQRVGAVAGYQVTYQVTGLATDGQAGLPSRSARLTILRTDDARVNIQEQSGEGSHTMDAALEPNGMLDLSDNAPPEVRTYNEVAAVAAFQPTVLTQRSTWEASVLFAPSERTSVAIPVEVRVSALHGDDLAIDAGGTASWRYVGDSESIPAQTALHLHATFHRGVLAQANGAIETRLNGDKNASASPSRTVRTAWTMHAFELGGVEITRRTARGS